MLACMFHSRRGVSNYTISFVNELVAQGNVSLVFHHGDIAYANMFGLLDFEKAWNEWFEAMEDTFSKAPLLVCPG